MPNTLYIFSNAFRILTSVYFMTSIFCEKDLLKHSKIKFFLLLIGVSTAIYVMLSAEWLHLAFNGFIYFILIFAFSGKLFERVLVAFILFSSNFVINYLMFGATDFFEFNEITRSATNIVCSFFYLAAMHIVIKVKNANVIRAQSNLSLYFVFLVPILSSVMILFTASTHTNSLYTALNFTLIALLNITVMYLFEDNAKKSMSEMRGEMLSEQNNAYVHELIVNKRSQKEVQMLKHDFKNHCLAMKILLESENYGELSEYISRIQSHIKPKNTFSCTGNSAIDSMLNYKLQGIYELGAKINTNLCIPETLDISPMDITVVFSNLLDNAYEALEKTVDRVFALEVIYDRGMLIITMSNTFSEKPIELGGKYLSTKDNKALHGLGLLGVQKTVKNYHGDIDIQVEKNTFTVNAILYCNVKDESMALPERINA